MPGEQIRSRSRGRQCSFVSRKAKGHRRRKGLGHLAVPSLLRNDVLPSLDLIKVPLSELPPTKREVRKIDPSHSREVAASIGAVGFCLPILIGP